MIDIWTQYSSAVTRARLADNIIFLQVYRKLFQNRIIFTLSNHRDLFEHVYILQCFVKFESLKSRTKYTLFRVSRLHFKIIFKLKVYSSQSKINWSVVRQNETQLMWCTYVYLRTTFKPKKRTYMYDKAHIYTYNIYIYTQIYISIMLNNRKVLNYYQITSIAFYML